MSQRPETFEIRLLSKHSILRPEGILRIARQSKILQHESRRVLMTVAEEQQLTDSETGRHGQLEPLVAAGDDPADLLIAMAGNTSRYPVIASLPGNIRKQRLPLRRRQQTQQRVCGCPTTALDYAEIAELGDGSVTVCDFRIVEFVQPQPGTFTRDQSGKQSLPGSGSRQQRMGVTSFMRPQQILVTIQHVRQHPTDVGRVVVRRRWLIGLKLRHADDSIELLVKVRLDYNDVCILVQ